MKKRALATYVVIALAVMGFVFWLISDALSNWAADPATNQFLVALVYLIFNPWYVVVLAYMVIAYPNKKLQSAVASLFVIIALELYSLPHLITINGVMPVSTTAQFFLEVAMFKSIPFLPQLGIIGTFILYWLIATLLIVAAHDLVEAEAFVGMVADELNKIRFKK